MRPLTMSKRPYLTGLILIFSTFLLLAGSVAAAEEKVGIRVFTPRADDLTGTGGSGFIVALRFKFPGDLDSTGVTIPGLNPDPDPDPDPDSESKAAAGSEEVILAEPSAASAGYGANPNFPGLVVLLSNNKSGAGQNLANYFTQIGVSHRKYAEEAEDEDESEGEGETTTTGTHIWASWLVSGDEFGTDGEIERAVLLVALVEGDAPDVVEDMNEDGKLTRKDLKMMEYKIMSKKVKRIPFDVNGF